jgi:hypothetical protein
LCSSAVAFEVHLEIAVKKALLNAVSPAEVKLHDSMLLAVSLCAQVGL